MSTQTNNQVQITDPIYSPYYTKPTLLSFLEQKNLSKGLSAKKKDELVSYINENINNNRISSEELTEWKKKLLHEGNKHIICFNYNTIEEVDFEQCLENVREEYDSIFDIESNDDYIELYFKNVFIYFPELEEAPTAPPQKNFITVIKIERNKHTYSISFLPPTDLFIWSDGEAPELIAITSNYLIKYYNSIINRAFKLNTYSNKLEYINVLSHIWTITNDAILTELAPLTDNLLNANQQYVTNCVNSIFNYNFISDKFGSNYEVKEEDYTTLNIESIKSEVLNKLRTTWFSFFINESKIPFEFRNQYGIIITESLQTQDGMKMKCGSKSIPLYNYKIHNDIIGNSLSETHECDEMMFEWSYNGKKIKTSLKCYNDYFYILFHRATLKEDIDYVLSTIESIKNGL